MEKTATFYDDAELFTQKLIHLTKNQMRLNSFQDGLTPLVENLIKIINLDVEDRFDVYDAPSGKRVLLLFAKDTDLGYSNAFFCDRFVHQGKTVDIFVLPNDPLLDKIRNAEILSALDRFYAFILETKKASAEYISPIEIVKHIFARYFYKFKYYSEAFELDERTVAAMKNDIEESLEGMITYDDVIKAIKDGKGADYFNSNEVLEKVSSEIYYQVIDELHEAVDEEDDEYEEEDDEE